LPIDIWFRVFSVIFSLLESGFPVHLLPIVVLPGSIAGKTVNQWHGIPAGVPVLAALGDLQCSVRAAMETTKDAVINISTSAQLSYVHLHSRAADLAKSSIAVECHPFTTCSSLAVAASLNGGNVLVQFTSMLQRWISELGLECPDINTLFSKLLVLGEVPSAMQVSPQLYGERHCPGMLASVNNISISLPSLAETFTALCDGLIANIASMINNKELMNAGVERIIGTGKALVKNPILQASVRKHFSFPLVMKSGSDAAVGAAQFAMQAMNQADQDG
jgi:sedoheptulokinase